jgi:hypothetical protein
VITGDPATKTLTQAVVNWVTYELGMVHGGVTRSSVEPPVFTGYYRDPDDPSTLIENEIVWVTVDIQAKIDDAELDPYLSLLKNKIQADLYQEKEIWMTVTQIQRII